ncbi:hypothetical protein E2562_039421 [Oryza meyeriana var. granulata]|uniref:FAD linked oxidase N-terminal domain-containing protein n=1 Tax=Oryza meyeriana var. granulata TaxID=110450 RepID=A0A6G1CY27_9ORYZ|nr:hypothetical protein E2562_039421 [Oryza meyeriana var. granulata]
MASSVRNPRFLVPGTVRPLCVVTPTNASHGLGAVLCGRRHGMRLRMCSGGHDYERGPNPGLAFPAMMMRKYGLSVDNVLDAMVVDANGRILDKKTMGRDYFWAISGGGESFSIVLSWKDAGSSKTASLDTAARRDAES